MAAWLGIALGLVRLLNFVFSKLDADAKAKATTALRDAEWIKASLGAIQDADSARDSVERDLRDNPDRVRAPDEFTRG